jgi:fructose-1,6-bisphosphatase I
MIKLDQLSASVLRNALSFTGKLQMVRPAKDEDEDGFEEGPDEHKPGVLIASGLDSRYVACFDPLDGSGNADAAICTGTVFGIFESNEDAEEEGIDDVVVGGGDGSYTGSKRDDANVRAVLQPGKNLRAAGYCLYSSATILVFSLGDGTHGFTLDPRVNEFVLTHPNIRIPPRGNVYSTNEANSPGWSDHVSTYIRTLKTGACETQEKYALRYIGSFVGDIHRTLMYGGIFLYPSDTVGHPKGNLQLLYKSAPLAFLVEQAGGKSTNGQIGLLEITPKRVHEKSPCFIGSPEDVDELMGYLK